MDRERDVLSEKDRDELGNLADISQRTKILSLGAIVGYALIAFFLVYWTSVQRDGVLEREDNPRLVERELQIRRGRILDAEGRVLVDSIRADNQVQRVYRSSFGGQVIGYYSVIHGTSGLEGGVDEVLRGSLGESEWQQIWKYEILHEPRVGYDVRSTLFIEWQEEAGRLLSGLRGAVILMSLPDRAIRVMVSSPSFDPNDLESQFDALISNEEGPLLNRATQALYQPGMVLEPFIIAAGLDRGLFSLSNFASQVEATIQVNGEKLACDFTPDSETTWDELLRIRCPSAMFELGNLMGAEAIRELYVSFGFSKEPVLPIEIQIAQETVVTDAGMAAIGQDSLTISPLQAALATAVLADRGRYGDASLVQSYQNNNGGWVSFVDRGSTEGVVSVESAQISLEFLDQSDGIVEHTATALAGPSGEKNGWYIGLTPVSNPRLLVVVMVEDIGDQDFSAQIGKSLIEYARQY